MDGLSVGNNKLEDEIDNKDVWEVIASYFDINSLVRYQQHEFWARAGAGRWGCGVAVDCIWNAFLGGSDDDIVRVFSSLLC